MISGEAGLVAGLGLVLLRGGSEENSGLLTTQAISHSGHQLSTYIMSSQSYTITGQVRYCQCWPQISFVSRVVHSVRIITHYGEPVSGSALPWPLVSGGQSKVPHGSKAITLVSQLTQLQLWSLKQSWFDGRRSVAGSHHCYNLSPPLLWWLWWCSQGETNWRLIITRASARLLQFMTNSNSSSAFELPGLTACG